MSSAWPTHLSWVRFPADGPRFDLARHADDDATGTYQWPAGAALASELQQHVNCQEKRVLDLSCGRGALGFTALALGAKAVVFADANPIVVDLVERTLIGNALQERATAVACSWGQVPPQGPFDIILGGDILYRPELFVPLAQSIASGLSPTGICLLSDPRTTLESALPTIFSAAGLHWTQQRQARYTLVQCEFSQQA
jgi:predicted nicotinamide N-methyase